MSEWGPVDEDVIREAERISTLAMAMRYSADRRVGALYAGNDAVILTENNRLREVAREIISLLGGESGTEPGLT